MTALRQQVHEMVDMMPESVLLNLIQLMKEENIKQTEKQQRIERKRIALEELKQLCKPLPNLDYDKALAEYREEKFGNANLD